MSQLTLRLCGPPAVLHGDVALAFRTHKTLALLLYLVVERTPQRRAHLCSLLWPERDSAHARALLRRTLAFLRDTLEEPATGDHLVVTAETLAINARSALATDLDVLHAAMACLDAPARQGSDDLAVIGSLQAAADAYTDEFLAGFLVGEAPAFEDWIAQRRATVLRSMERIFERLSTLLVMRGEHRRALAVATRWTAYSPLDEHAYMRVMEAHMRRGDPL